LKDSNYLHKDWPLEKEAKVYQKIFTFILAFEFYLIIWLMNPQKNFEKIAILKI
jgi:hypothetical protein